MFRRPRNTLSIRKGLWVLWLALLGGTTLRGEDAAFPGGTIRLPAGWSAISMDGEASLSGDSATQWSYAAAWASEGARATMLVGVRPGYTEIHESKAILAQHALEAAIQGGSVRVSDLGAVRLPAGVAYRIECQSDTPSGVLRQIQYIVSGRDTVVITFSGHEDGLSELESQIAETIASLSLTRTASLVEEAPAWLCASCLGLLASMILVVRLGARSLGVRCPPRLTSVG